MDDPKKKQGAQNGEDTSRLLQAMRFAAEKHRDHRRKGSIAAPYINHPIIVAQQLAQAGQAENTALLIAALLHDVVEDTETSFEELEHCFGARVTAIVREVTDNKSLSEKERKAQAVAHIDQKSHDAQRLKLSDLIANIHDVIHHPPCWSQERKARYFNWGEAIGQAVRGVDPLLEAQLKTVLTEGRRLLKP